jgi:signal transduction histidine kinase
MAGFEERFRALREQTAEALREQAEAFESVMQAGTAAMRDRAAVTVELTSLKSKVQTLTDRHDTLQTTFEATSRDLDEHRAARAKLESKVAELTETCETTQRRLTGANNANDELRSANTAFEKDLKEAAATNEKLQAALVNQKRGNEELEAAKQAIEQELATERASVGRMEARAEAAESANRELHAAKESLETSVKDLSARNEKISTKLVSVESANGELQQIKASLEQKLSATESKVSTLHEDLADAAREHEKALSIAETLKERISDIEADNEALKEAAEAAEQEQSKLADTRKTLETCLAELSVKAETLGSERRAPEISRAAEKEVPALKERIAELEAELEGAEPTAPTSLASEALCRELAEQASAAKELVGILRHPRIDNNRRKTLVSSATDLASQLDVLNVTAELSLCDTVIEIEPQEINLIDVLQGTMESLAPTVSKKNLKLTNRIDPKVPAKIEADRIRLEQLIAWSTTYVTRHAAEGEVSVLIGTEAGADGATFVRFHLCNDGLGMSPDKLDSLINPHMVDEDSNTVDDVAAFRCLAEAMGGELCIEAAGKEGFAVRFTIPTKRPVASLGNRRNSDRVLQELLQCNLGPVVDLSPTGMRVICSKQPKKHVDVEIGNSLQSMTVRGFVVWTNKLDRKQFEVGLRFIDLRPAQSEQLSRIAKKHGLCAKA